MSLIKLFAAIPLIFCLDATAAETATLPQQLLGEQSMDLSAPNVKVRVIKLTLPKGWKIATRIHPIPGPRYVLKGRVRIATDVKAEEFGPGQLFWETGSQYLSENVSDSEVDLLVMEMLPEPTSPKAGRTMGGKAPKGKTK
jgi:quercetin dioxygenase-like cupin family protein